MEGALLCPDLSFPVKKFHYVCTHLYLRELLGAWSVSVPETGEVGAVDPLTLPVVVEVRPHLRPDGLVQLHRVASKLRFLGELKEESSALRDIL